MSMEVVLSAGKAHLFIEYKDEILSFTAITPIGTPFEFHIDESKWKVLKSFIDKSISEQKPAS